MNIRGYDADVKPLSARLGGGFVAYAPALRGCLADGETRAEAIENLDDAIRCWLEAAKAKGWWIPRAASALLQEKAQRKAHVGSDLSATIVA